MGYKATEQRPKTTQLVDDDQLNNILGTKMESGQLICSNDYKDYSELEKDTQVGDLIKPQPFENINGRPEGTYGGVDIYKDNRIIAITPEDSGEDSYVFIFEQGNATNLNFTSLSGYTNAQIELVGGGGAGHSDGMGGGGGYYTYLEGKSIAAAKNYPITVGLGGAKDGANGGKSIFGGITDANANGGQAGQSLSNAAEVKMYKVTKSATGSNMYYYGDYPNGQSVGGYYKVKLPSTVYLPLKNTTKTTKTLRYNGDGTWKTGSISNLVEGKKVGDKGYYNYNDSRGVPYFQIPGDATITEAVEQRYYGNTSGKRGQGGALGTLKLPKAPQLASITYGGYAREGGFYGTGGDAMNLGLNGEYLYKREKVKRNSTNPSRMYGSRTNGVFTPIDFFYWSGWKQGTNPITDPSSIIDMQSDNIIGTIKEDQEFELNFIYYKNGSNISKVSRPNILMNHAKEPGNTFNEGKWSLYYNSNYYYLCYVNLTQEMQKQPGRFVINTNDTTIKNQWIPCWVEGITPTGTIVENHAHLPAASQRAGGDGVVILKLTKPK